MSGRDIGACVRQRLLNKSRTQGRPFQELLQYFAVERFLYRLANSSYSDRFVLKGALLLTAGRAPQSRPTMDIDLEGRVNNQLDHIKEVVGAVCEFDVEPNGTRSQPGFNRDQPPLWANWVMQLTYADCVGRMASRDWFITLYILCKLQIIPINHPTVTEHIRRWS